jgi:hypothetical protein
MKKPKTPKKRIVALAASRTGQGSRANGSQASIVLKELTNLYLNSGDFNGIRAVQLADRLGQPWPDVKCAVTSLIERELVGVLDEKSDVNPAILRVDFEPKAVQLGKLDEPNVEHTFIYPRTAHLKAVVRTSDYTGRPYLLELALGYPQFPFRSFDLSVLEFYRNDPRYMYENRDIDGFISVRHEYYQSNKMAEKDQILLESFGFSFDNNLNRAVAVFLRYLARLSAEHQQIWKAKQLTGEYRLHRDYLNYTIIGDWGEAASDFCRVLRRDAPTQHYGRGDGARSFFSPDIRRVWGKQAETIHVFGEADAGGVQSIRAVIRQNDF